MGVKKELGQKIKILRKKHGLTQEQLSEKIDISPRALSGIELGEYYAKAETLDKIISVLNISTEELFSNDGFIEPSKMYDYISKNLEVIKNDKQKLKILYRIIKALILE